jgi:ferric-dicitrate binding protein FerR (iron transport regulator)
MYAWLWLAECSTDPAEARHAAQLVLAQRPTHWRARAILSNLEENPPGNQPKQKQLTPAAQAPEMSQRRPAGLLALGFLVLIAFIALAVVMFREDAGTTAEV